MQSNQHSPSLEQLPESFALRLTQVGAISVTGDEADKYLQGQLTCDVNLLATKHLLVGSHCDAKGKVFSAFRLINHNERRLLIQSNGSLDASMAELKKFGVFAKVDINNANDLGLLALVGKKAEQFIQTKFNALPDSFTPVIEANGVSVAYICGATNRYLLVGAAAQIDTLSTELEIPLLNEDVWTLLEITSGFVHMNAQSVNEYVPQMLNIQHLNGISFTKGCYLGQETVARMKYLGKNKRALYALSGSGDLTLSDEAVLEKSLGENWRRAGSIIASYQADDNQVYIQAVLANDIESDAILRIKDQENVELSLMALPYSLTPDEE